MNVSIYSRKDFEKLIAGGNFPKITAVISFCDSELKHLDKDYKRLNYSSVCNDVYYCEMDDLDLEWFPGFAVSQKQKSINSLHKTIREKSPKAFPLEVSTKSTCPLGIKLSAFNLKLDDYTAKAVALIKYIIQNQGDLIISNFENFISFVL